VRDEKQAIVQGLLGHLTWLEDAGIQEVPTPPGPPKRAAVPTRTSESRERPEVAAASASPSPGASSLTLPQIREEIGECTRCKLHTGRTKLVFGVGNPNAELVFVGEGPGADEDLKGEPFVGKAGQLLDKMIQAMGMSRAEVYICNVVKCRPPGNRNPEPDEIETCSPFLAKQIEAIRPRVLVSLGKVASQVLLNDATPITRLRGRWREAFGVPLMPTFHPAYLLRSPGEKAKAWEDLKAVVQARGRELPRR